MRGVTTLASLLSNTTYLKLRSRCNLTL